MKLDSGTSIRRRHSQIHDARSHPQKIRRDTISTSSSGLPRTVGPASRSLGSVGTRAVVSHFPVLRVHPPAALRGGKMLEKYNEAAE